MLAQAFGTRYVHVPYRSGAQMVQSIMTGDVQFGIAALASATPLMRDGKIRGIAMVGDRRFPPTPTSRRSGSSACPASTMAATSC